MENQELKIKPLKLEDIPEFYKPFNTQVVEQLTENLRSQQENIFIMGLALKGFHFENNHDLERFVKKRCRCENNTIYREKVYYVDETPFLFHKYETSINVTPKVRGDVVVVTGSLGSYKFL